jgi:hypothetical protein
MNTDLHLADWNQAHERLRRYLKTFALADRVLVERLALRLLDEARELHRANPGQHPTTITLRHAQAQLARWLATTLTGEPNPSPQALTSGTVALLLSRMAQEHPADFMGADLPAETRDSFRHALVVTGPDLTISSMTPRHLDYGPLLDLARHTWHRWDTRTFATAVLFWLGVYGICYWFFAEYL